MFQAPPFQPATFLRNPHLQTFAGNVLRKGTGLHFDRQRYTTPDNDFIDVDYPYLDAQQGWPKGPDQPILVALHGLEGHARRTYMQQLYRQAIGAGLRCVGLNARGCSGEDNHTPYQYHAGFITDVTFLVTKLTQRYPQAKIVVAGFSLGGNIILNYVGSDFRAANVVACGVISPPVDLVDDIQYFGRSSNWMYDRYFLRSLKKKLKLRLEKFPDITPFRDGLTVNSLYAFDDVCTGPLNGYANAEAYYTHTRALNRIDTITIPTLLIRAQDDPFFAPSIPQRVYANQNIVPLLPTFGGHIGFVGANTTAADATRFWAETQTIRFFSDVLGLH